MEKLDFGKGAVPLYIQIKKIIKDKILSKEYAPGDSLPSEAQLQEIFHVSRITARQAIAQLESEMCIRDSGSIVVGITAGLEEARANGAEEIDDEMINGIRAGLMGPLAGIGDSLIVGTYIPVLLGIALGLAEGGSIIGPLFYIVVWNVTSIFFQKWIYNKGYELGGSAVEVIVGEQATALRESVIVMGQVIVGAMAGTWVSITTSVQLTTSIQNKTEMVIEGSKVIEKVTGTQEVPVLLQEKLDGAFPGVLTLLFVLGCWWLMAKKAISPIKIMLLMVVVAIVGVLVGFFDPNLSY